MKHLHELFQYATIKPVVNQVEFHPFLQQRELLDFCNKEGTFQCPIHCVVVSQRNVVVVVIIFVMVGE